MPSININQNFRSTTLLQSMPITPDQSPQFNSNPFKFQPSLSSLPTPSPSSPSSPLSSSPRKILGIVDEVVPNLTSQDIEFAEVDLPNPELNLRSIRSQLVKQFPYLVASPEPIPKARKANAPPPALVPRSVSPSPEEKACREKSLILNVEKEERRSVIKALVVLENRKGYFKRTGLAPEGSVVSNLPVVPSPWMLDFDSAALLAEGKRKNKKTFELPDLKTDARCGSCSGSRIVTCQGCASIEADECFWCDGSGTRKLDGKICKVCQGKTTYQCSPCKNSGTVECQECNSEGAVEMSYFVDVVLRSVELPAIPVSMLFDDQFGPPTAQAVRAMAVDKVLQAVQKLCYEKSSKGAPVAAVLARCLWEKSTLRTLSVFKPLNSKWKGLGEDSLSESGELDPDTVFYGLAPSTEVQTHYFTFSRDQQIHPIHTNSRSRSGSKANSRANSAAPSPVVSPRASVADLRSAFRSSTSAPDHLSSGSVGRKSSGGYLPSSTSAPNQLGNSQRPEPTSSSSSPKIKPRKSFTNLFSRSSSFTNLLSANASSSIPPIPRSRSVSENYELQTSTGKNIQTTSFSTSPPQIDGSFFKEIINEEIQT